MSECFDVLLAELKERPRESDPEHWDRCAGRARELIEVARAAGDPETANRAWHLSAVAVVRAKTCRAFAAMREGDFRSAWPDLEQIETAIGRIERNAILGDEFGIGQLKRMISDWQALYPYTVFASPEIIVRQQECSICGTPVSPVRPCGHLPNYVYAGEICARRITKADVISIALVRDPVQKYSVLIPNPDPFDYATVRFVVDRLAGPFSRWRLVRTTILRDHSYFPEWSRDGNCPCHSGFRYDACCLTRPGVSVPHNQIEFEEAPPSHLPRFAFRRRANADGPLEDVPIADEAA